MQCIRIVAYAEDAVRFHIVIHDDLYHDLTIFQFYRSQHRTCLLYTSDAADDTSEV